MVTDLGTVKLDLGRIFLVRVEHDSDIIKFIADFAKKQGIEVATFTSIGALKRAKLGFYDQIKHQYLETHLDMHLEIASCIGNISIKDGDVFVHAHVVLSDQNGTSKSGHLIEGIVFAVEVHMIELTGKKIERTKDAVTGLSLWNI
jgi:uncharacterized protein